MPTGNFFELCYTKNTLQTFSKTKVDGDIRSLLECDLEYPTTLHKKTKKLPLCPKITVKVEALLYHRK